MIRRRELDFTYRFYTRYIFLALYFSFIYFTRDLQEVTLVLKVIFIVLIVLNIIMVIVVALIKSNVGKTVDESESIEYLLASSFYNGELIKALEERLSEEYIITTKQKLTVTTYKLQIEHKDILFTLIGHPNSGWVDLTLTNELIKMRRKVYKLTKNDALREDVIREELTNKHYPRVYYDIHDKGKTFDEFAHLVKGLFGKAEKFKNLLLEECTIRGIK